MAIEEGHFRLYARVVPALKAGDYRFAGSQGLSAKDAHNLTVTASQLPVQDLATHVRVTSPRYLLPPDQVLSTYPPAGTEGAYGSRLPQVVIKRRTLPWERAVDGGIDGTPWLALVVFAEGEAEVLKNIPVAQCVSPGVTLDGEPDVAKGSCLEIRTSMVEKIMPTRKDVPLLAHAREVNINDTELMLGDDDGFLAVVISNRLPLGARNPDGTEAPVKYHAVLVSLEGPGQFSALLPTSPPAQTHTDHLVLDLQTAVYAPADYDNEVMESAYTQSYVPSAPADDGRTASARGEPAKPLGVTAYRAVVAPDTLTTANSGTGAWAKADAKSKSLVSVDASTVIVAGGIKLADPKLRFPALLHWTFTTIGDQTFELLMRDADSGLLGTLGRQPEGPIGRPPPEVVETGHVGLDQRTYRGDVVRAWYRGPALPHPADLDSPRLPLAHTGDQLRAVIPDGREDISLAAAFEIGRLLALSQPSMVSSLLRWRQLGYQAARIDTLWTAILKDLDLGVELAPGRLLGTHFGRGLARILAANPAETVGLPRDLFTSGSPMVLDGDPIQLVTRGFGIDVATDLPMGELLNQLRDTEVPRKPRKLSTAAGRAAMARALAHGRDSSLAQLVAGALAADQPDALDRALAGRRAEQEDDH